ncbi:MAG: hypothetical protein ACYDD1_20990 [Caulobacteraceae bacterium]
MNEDAAKGLAEIDTALGQRPHKDDLALQAAMKALCKYRDVLIAQKRESKSDEDARRLEHLNGVISIVAGTHYPLKEVPWDELVKARGWLVALIGEPVQA